MNTLYTPNIERGNPFAGRYILFRRGDDSFSITPKGKIFLATVTRDSCGLGCECGAYITPLDKHGQKLLEKAKTL